MIQIDLNLGRNDYRYSMVIAGTQRDLIIFFFTFLK